MALKVQPINMDTPSITAIVAAEGVANILRAANANPTTYADFVTALRVGGTYQADIPNLLVKTTIPRITKTEEA